MKPAEKEEGIAAVASPNPSPGKIVVGKGMACAGEPLPPDEYQKQSDSEDDDEDLPELEDIILEKRY